MKIFIPFAIFLFNFCGKINSIEINCKYIQTPSNGYCCMVQNSQLITSKDDRKITSVVGQHLSGKSNEDVKYFMVQGKKVFYFPRGLTKFFKNIEIVQNDAAGLKEISKYDLKQFGANLKRLWLAYNELEVIESDLFEFNKNLEKISLSSNKILHVGTGAFDSLENLEELGFRDNICYNFHASIRYEIYDLKQQLERRCKNLKYLTSVRPSTTTTEMPQESSDLEEENRKLKGKVSEYEAEVDKLKKEIVEMSEKLAKMQTCN